MCRSIFYRRVFEVFYVCELIVLYKMFLNRSRRNRHMFYPMLLIIPESVPNVVNKKRRECKSNRDDNDWKGFPTLGSSSRGARSE